MTFHLNDRETKEKLLNTYKADIILHREKNLQERQLNLKEQQEHLDKIKRELEEDRVRIVEKKKNLMKENEEFARSIGLTGKKVSEKNIENLSLDMGSEQRLERMKDYMNQLSNKVDRNMYNYLNFKQNKRTDESSYSGLAGLASLNLHATSGVSPLVGNNLSNNFHQDKYNEPIYTNDSVLDKIYGKNYGEYKQIQRKVLNYNKDIINEKQRYKETEIIEKRRTNEDRLKELENLNNISMQEKVYKDYRQKIYRDVLEDQIKNAINNNVCRLNKYDEIITNPYKISNGNLGTTILNHNTILNPVHNYRYNRYLYKNDLQNAGSLVIN